MAIELRLPELGEGIEAGDVVRVTVSVGDLLKRQQTVCELETDKALVEVPADQDGVVQQVHVKAGDRLEVGGLIVTLEAEAKDTPAQNELTAAPAKTTATAQPVVQVEEELAAPLVRESLVPRPGPHTPEGQPSCGRPDCCKLDPAQHICYDNIAPAAGPATRRYARGLGVELHKVNGSGRAGRISKADVDEYVRGRMTGVDSAAADGCPVVPVELPDFSQWGTVSREKLSLVREKTAEHMSLANTQIPQVTQFEQIDITELEELRQRFKADAVERGGRLTSLVFIIKALVAALKAYPRFNASLDWASRELVIKHHYHIGIAVDTPRGLLVPVLRDVDRLNTFELARELTALGERARTGKVSLDELRGGTFSISNQGGIGGLEFTPIVNHPEAAILGIGQARWEPKYANLPPAEGELPEPQLIMPTALSYDHRIVDGADAARFITMLKRSLEDPARLLLGL